MGSALERPRLASHSLERHSRHRVITTQRPNPLVGVAPAPLQLKDLAFGKLKEPKENFHRQDEGDGKRQPVVDKHTPNETFRRYP